VVVRSVDIDGIVDSHVLYGKQYKQRNTN